MLKNLLWLAVLGCQAPYDNAAVVQTDLSDPKKVVLFFIRNPSEKMKRSCDICSLSQPPSWRLPPVPQFPCMPTACSSSSGPNEPLGLQLRDHSRLISSRHCHTLQLRLLSILSLQEAWQLKPGLASCGPGERFMEQFCFHSYSFVQVLERCPIGD